MRIVSNSIILSAQWLLLLWCLQSGVNKVNSFYRSIVSNVGSNKISLTMSSTAPSSDPIAILFDCDGVIVETEELHRIAYNKAFDYYQVKLGGKSGELVQWDKSYYDVLQNTVGGGKPKMRYYFNEVKQKWPSVYHPTTKLPPRSEKGKEELLELLQSKKMEFYDEIVTEKAIPRNGIVEIFDQALNDPSIKLGICSASTKQGFEKIIDLALGKERISKLQVIIAGDDVQQRKPHPQIYQLAAEKLAISPERSLVIEDSLIGLKAAKAAGMKCIITYTDGTRKEDFLGNGADAVYSEITQVSLQQLVDYLREGKPLPESVQVSSTETEEKHDELATSEAANLKAKNSKRILRKVTAQQQQEEIGITDAQENGAVVNQDVSNDENAQPPTIIASDVSKPTSKEIADEDKRKADHSVEASSQKATSELETHPETSTSSPPQERATQSNTESQAQTETSTPSSSPSKKESSGWSLHKLVSPRFFQK